MAVRGSSTVPSPALRSATIHCSIHLECARSRGKSPRSDRDLKFTISERISVNIKYFTISCICAQKQYVDFRSVILDLLKAGFALARLGSRASDWAIPSYNQGRIVHEEIWRHLRGAIWAQSTNQPPWIQIFSTQPCICSIFSVGISVNSRKFSRAR